ncbi:hypothetical protein F8M41_015304 [Gigaspora margarita]|uniref:Uncharacterized protein n=1 Tax=Gigaspora margarita TaxID=4874 RepID=A0A8H3ZZG1_GIGMA|nr:hypothetical protein F8M41_015304 [Gigaspora margarita]
MVQYEITPQYLLPTSENFITIEPILSRAPNNTYVHMQHFGTIETNIKSFFNTSTHNLDTLLDPQPVDKFQYFVQGFDSGSVENFPTNGIMEMVVEIMKIVEMLEQVPY